MRRFLLCAAVMLAVSTSARADDVDDAWSACLQAGLKFERDALASGTEWPLPDVGSQLRLPQEWKAPCATIKAEVDRRAAAEERKRVARQEAEQAGKLRQVQSVGGRLEGGR